MLFELSAEEISASVGAENIVRPAPEAFPEDARGCAGALVLAGVGIPREGIFSLFPVGDSGEFPRVRDAVELSEYEAPVGVGDWPVFGSLVNCCVVLDPKSGRIHAFSDSEDRMLDLHSDMSSLLHLLFEIARTKEDLHPGNADEAAMEAYEERRYERLDRVQATVAARDPLPFAGDDSVWAAALDDIAAGILRG